MSIFRKLKNDIEDLKDRIIDSQGSVSAYLLISLSDQSDGSINYISYDADSLDDYIRLVGVASSIISLTQNEIANQMLGLTEDEEEDLPEFLNLQDKKKNTLN